MRMGNNRPTTRSKNKRIRPDDNAEATAEILRYISIFRFRMFLFFHFVTVAVRVIPFFSFLFFSLISNTGRRH